MIIWVSFWSALEIQNCPQFYDEGKKSGRGDNKGCKSGTENDQEVRKKMAVSKKREKEYRIDKYGLGNSWSFEGRAWKVQSLERGMNDLRRDMKPKSSLSEGGGGQRMLFHPPENPHIVFSY